MDPRSAFFTMSTKKAFLKLFAFVKKKKNSNSTFYMKPEIKQKVRNDSFNA